MSDSLWPPRTIARQVPWPMQFSRQEYWSGLPFPPPGDLPDPGIKPGFPASPSWQRILYWLSCLGRGFPAGSDGKESGCNSTPGSGRSPGGGHGNPLQYFCLENSHGQRSLAGYNPWGCKQSDTTVWLSIAPGKSINLDYWHWKWFGGSGHTLKKICQRRHLPGHPSLSSAPVPFIELYHFVVRLPDSTHHIYIQFIH